MNKTIKLFEKHYKMLLDKKDARSLPMKVLRIAIDNVKLELQKEFVQ